MKILGIIAARGGSKEIKMKNLVILGKKPLLYYTVNISLNSKMIDRTIVSTDNAKISHYAKKIGAEVIHRPKRLSGPRIAVEEAMIHVLDSLKRKEDYIPDVIVLLQNTCPFKTIKDIDSALNFFKKEKYDSILSGYVSHHFYLKLKNDKVIPMNYDPLKRPNRQEIKNQFVENGAFYISKHDLFRKNKCRISGRIGLYLMPKERSIDINSEYDLFIARQIFKHHIHERY